MDAVKSWGITICFAALAAGIAGIVAPSGKMEKVYKFAVSLFFLCCMLVPLFNIKNIHFDKVELYKAGVVSDSQLNSTVSEQTAEVAQQNIAELIKNCCRNCGVEPESVSVKVTPDGKAGTMSVQSAEVVLKPSDSAQSQKIADSVMSSLGIAVKIREGEK